MLKTAVDGTISVINAAKAAGVKRIVLTSSLAAVECGNDEGTLTEETWSRAEVYDSAEKLEKTQWATHYTYVKSKVEQEKAALSAAETHGIDMRVVVPGERTRRAPSASARVGGDGGVGCNGGVARPGTRASTEPEPVPCACVGQATCASVPSPPAASTAP